MEFIFENVDERDRFFNEGPCPSKCGFNNVKNCHDLTCRECWGQTGVKYSVRDVSSLSIGKQEIEQLRQSIAAMFGVLTSVPAGEKEPKKTCRDCKYSNLPSYDHPCYKCTNILNRTNRFEPKGVER